ncbi:unnamed protein product [Rhodiola kirilowii]
MELHFPKNRYWRKRQYNRLNGETHNIRRSGKVVRLGRLRKLRPIKKLRLVSPCKLWRRFKDAYVDMMLRLAGSVGELNTGNGFGAKHIPKARGVKLECTAREEFEKRIVYEIYKSLVASRQLGSAYA